MKAVELCVNRFDDDTKESFLNLYTKIDAGVDVSKISTDDQSEIEQDEVSEDETDTNI